MEKEKNGILLESGTNEIEIMEFTIDGNLYGINVAKVREIMMAEKVHPMPHSHPAVEGIFKPRDTVITVVNLPKYLARRDVESRDKELFIITNFNKMSSLSGYIPWWASAGSPGRTSRSRTTPFPADPMEWPPALPNAMGNW